ncbi:hypothetical protein BSKO_10859 [Bryopsis sp. KO-2023]|nr:hypothetical protein BSKO_10859 [Bryopsis sp. KO-2023]
MKKIPITNKEDQESILNEARLISSFDHANIISYKESFMHENALCIVTSYCENGDLFSKIRALSKEGKGFSEVEVMDIFLQIAMALEHIHSRKVLHRDLKTQNIFIARGGVIKIGDFGISKVLASTEDFATTVTGTPYYMAPEICTNQPYTYKSDIWSLGCVLYELCTLQHAFAANSLLSLVYQIVRGDVPPIPEQFSEEMKQLVVALLQKDAACRPSLVQIFQTGYVQRHMQDFRSRMHNMTKRQISIRRRTRSREVEVQPPLQRGRSAIRTANNDHDDACTPRERMRRRKERRAAERERVLKEATAAAASEAKQLARERKQIMWNGQANTSTQCVQEDECASGRDTTTVSVRKGETCPMSCISRPDLSICEATIQTRADHGDVRDCEERLDQARPGNTIIQETNATDAIDESGGQRPKTPHCVKLDNTSRAFSFESRAGTTTSFGREKKVSFINLSFDPLTLFDHFLAECPPGTTSRPESRGFSAGGFKFGLGSESNDTIGNGGQETMVQDTGAMGFAIPEPIDSLNLARQYSEKEESQHDDSDLDVQEALVEEYVSDGEVYWEGEEDGCNIGETTQRSGGESPTSSSEEYASDFDDYFSEEEFDTEVATDQMQMIHNLKSICIPFAPEK